MLISNLIGTKAFNIVTALDLGEINSIGYKDGKISYLCTTLGYCFRTTDIVAINNVITCTTYSCTKDIVNQVFPYTNANIITTNGKLVGELQDISITKDFKINKLICSTKNLGKFEIKSYSPSAIIIKAPERKKSSQQHNTDAQTEHCNDLTLSQEQKQEVIEQILPECERSHNIIDGKDKTFETNDSLSQHNKYPSEQTEHCDDLTLSQEQKQEVMEQILPMQENIHIPDEDKIFETQTSNTQNDINTKVSTEQIPTIVANYQFLLGRTLTKNILSPRGSLLFASGHQITQSDIDQAKHLGKLVQLTLYSQPLKI